MENQHSNKHFTITITTVLLEMNPPQQLGWLPIELERLGSLAGVKGLKAADENEATRRRAPSFARDFVRLNPHEPRKKPSTSFHYTGWLIRILRMVCYNPYITLHNWVVKSYIQPTQPRFFSWLTWFHHFHPFSTVFGKPGNNATRSTRTEWKVLSRDINT